MNVEQKIKDLKANHFNNWSNTYRQVENELSDKQTLFCVCGKLATGLHEGRCRKFANKVAKETALRLEHLIGQAKVSG